ncbi:MAG TPA: AraC family transcriptional regulator [Armatimonadota bacterium]|jgi:AraC-like DNA-binding protein
MPLAYTFEHQISCPDDLCAVVINHLPDGFPAHSHQYVEIFIALTGSSDHLIAHQRYRINTGDVYVLQGDIVHGFEHATPDFSICNVLIREDVACLFTEQLRTLPGYQALFLLEPAHRRWQEFPSRLRLGGPQVQEVLTLLHRLKDELTHRQQGTTAMVQAVLLQLIIVLCRRYASLEDDETANLLRLSEAVIYLEAHIRQPIRVSELARIAHISERHFLRLFRKIYQLPPMARILQLRIQHACALLRTGTVNVTDAAYASGFQDSNYFSRQFRRLVGCSPREYRCRGHQLSIDEISSPHMGE